MIYFSTVQLDQFFLETILNLPMNEHNWTTELKKRIFPYILNTKVIFAPQCRINNLEVAGSSGNWNDENLYY
jgi:hypothetical protein